MASAWGYTYGFPLSPVIIHSQIFFLGTMLVVITVVCVQSKLILTTRNHVVEECGSNFWWTLREWARNYDASRTRCLPESIMQGVSCTYSGKIVPRVTLDLLVHPHKDWLFLLTVHDAVFSLEPTWGMGRAVDILISLKDSVLLTGTICQAGSPFPVNQTSTSNRLQISKLSMPSWIDTLLHWMISIF